MKPGEDFIEQGLKDLAQGRESIPAMLVAIGAPRLRRSGLTVPEHAIQAPEHRLYRLLCDQNAANAYSQYNSLIRRLVSFERALECGN